jgi:hypothetical protein
LQLWSTPFARGYKLCCLGRSQHIHPDDPNHININEVLAELSDRPIETAHSRNNWQIAPLQPDDVDCQLSAVQHWQDQHGKYVHRAPISLRFFEPGQRLLLRDDSGFTDMLTMTLVF